MLYLIEYYGSKRDGDIVYAREIVVGTDEKAHEVAKAEQPANAVRYRVYKEV